MVAADAGRRQSAQDDLDAVMEELRDLLSQQTDTVTITRKRMERWSRHLGRALLDSLTDDARNNQTW